MKKLYCNITLLLLLFVFSHPVFGQTDTITILSLNDTHSNIAPLAPRTADLQGTRGGVARAATFIGLTRMTDQNVLLLHAGDSFIGDISFNYSYGVAELTFLKALGLDAMTLGNHEFDLMPSTLKGALDASMAGSPIPFLSLNSIFAYDTSGLAGYVQPYIIKQFGSSKIGIIGLTTPETNVLSSPAPVILDTNLIVITTGAIDSLKAKGCKAVILLSHLGLELDKVLASYLTGIDLIISGHDHCLLNNPVYVNSPNGKAVPIVQSDAFYTHIGKTKISVSAGEVKLISFNNIPLDQTIPEEPTVKGMVENLIASIEGVYGNVFTRQVGYATEDFEEMPENLFNNGSHETAVGNLVSDAFRWKTGVQIAIEPGGSTAQKLYKGPVVPADVFRVVGYGFNPVNGLGFRIVTFKLTGLELWTAFEKTLAMIGYSDEFLPQVSGMKYSFDLNKLPGQRLQQISINGNPINFDSTYTVASNEMLIMIMSNPLFNVNMTDVYVFQDQTEFQVLTEYIASHSPLIPRRDGSVLATPVELSSFTAQQSGRKIELVWTTKTETNNKGFEVQRRTNGGNWEMIAFIHGHGTSAAQNNYRYSDFLSSDRNSFFFYRLKQIDFDGTYNYSTEIKTEFAVLNDFKLYQNYPNPFNPATNIKFSLPSDGRATLKIYNAIGQEVLVLLNKELPGGSHTIEWRTENLPSGIYIAKLECGKFSTSIKMLLLK